jgi:hypothetical protein
VAARTGGISNLGSASFSCPVRKARQVRAFGFHDCEVVGPEFEAETEHRPFVSAEGGVKQAGIAVFHVAEAVGSHRRVESGGDRVGEL